MTEPVDPHISEDALASRTEGIRTALGETVVETAELKDNLDKLQLLALIASVLSALALAMSIIALVFAVHASHKSDQNSKSIDDLSQQQAASITDVQAQQCVTDNHLLGFYSVDARKLYAGGPTNYDQQYLKLQTSADHMKCGLAHVVPGS
jgi:hypothetical protein